MVRKIYENSLYVVYMDEFHGIGHIHSKVHNDDTLGITGIDMIDLETVVTEPGVTDQMANDFIEEFLYF